MRVLNGSSNGLLGLYLSLTIIATHVLAQEAPSGLPNLSSLSSGDISSAASTATVVSSPSGVTQTSQGSSAHIGTDASSISSAAVATDLPNLTSVAYDGPTNLPNLSGAYSYPAPSVPPTAMAPFMQKSSLPQGTVFICAGAVLGFFGFMVLVWRGLVAWSLHRSVRRDNYGISQKHRSRLGNAHKNPFRNTNASLYSHTHGSSLSLEPLTKSGMGGSKMQNPPSSLFFSPTAGAGPTTHSRGNSAGYFPAGYYGAGAAAPANGFGVTNLGGGSGGGRMSLADLGPRNRGYTRARSIEPIPRSPSLPPSRDRENIPSERLSYMGASIQPSSITNTQRGSRTRAPSALLDDLFETYPPDAVAHE